MPELNHKSVVVLGLGQRGQAACGLLVAAGARVRGLDPHDSPALRETAAKLGALGVPVDLGCTQAPDAPCDLVVLSPGVAPTHPLVQGLQASSAAVIGELELAFQFARCLTLAVTGTNGKTTTARMIGALLAREHRHAVLCGQTDAPACVAVSGSKELDFLVFVANAFQLEATDHFRPSVAVVTNLAPDHLDRFASFDAYCQSVARVFARQEAFDWAIVQSEALATLNRLGLAPRGKVVTFSADDDAADLYYERGLLLSRVPGWEGPLLDTATCALRGPHQAENLMAALAVGRALRVPLESGVTALRELTPATHCGEVIAERHGVRFINESKATNPHALQGAVRAVPPAPGGLPNVWLIAGGRDKRLDYHACAPLISRRVKGAFLLGEAREQLRAAWGLFTPCMWVNSLAEAVTEAAKRAVPGDVVLLAPACSGRDHFRDYQHRGEAFRAAVLGICEGDNENVAP